jgi:hypothetical protein
MRESLLIFLVIAVIVVAIGVSAVLSGITIISKGGILYEIASHGLPLYPPWGMGPLG